MKQYILDTETNGLFQETNKLHSLCLRDVATGELFSFTDNNSHNYDGTIIEGLRLINGCRLIGHNAIGFDIPVIQKLYPWFKPHGQVMDTQIAMNLLYLDMEGIDYATKNRRVPNQLIGSHSLEAWGYRIGALKGEYKKEENDDDRWAVWTPEMQEYCMQDVEVCWQLYRRIRSKKFSQQAMALEHKFAVLISRQEKYGVLLDVGAATKLVGELTEEMLELRNRMVEEFGPEIKTTIEIPKHTRIYKDPNRPNRIAGEEFIKTKVIPFNPTSRTQILARLIKDHGWEPKVFTKKGNPKIDDEILSELPYPEYEGIAKLFMLEKRISQISTGNEAWLRHMNPKTHRIHGRCKTLGAITSRCTHSSPNLAQVPAKGKPYGGECRACFVAADGKVIVGADAAGLELRCLGHYMHEFDGGTFAHEVVNGDVHWINAQAIFPHLAGIERDKNNPDHDKYRDLEKTIIYAFLYGSGDELIGKIVSDSPDEKELKREGKRVKDNLLKGLPALKRLIDKVKKEAKTRGYIIGLDGRQLPIRHQHAALNTLLQGAGAIVMKQALVEVDQLIQNEGFLPGENYEYVLNVHDEFQIECDENIAEDIMKLAERSFPLAGKKFGFKCELSGEAKCGNSWKETH